jgi:hypothetical protein
MQMIYYRKIFVFPVFVCILENASENILQYLARCKMKKKKFRNPLLSANPPPQCTVNPPQTTIKKKKPQTHRHSKPTNPQTHHHSKPSQQKNHKPSKPRKPSKPTNRLIAKPTAKPRSAKPQCEKVESPTARAQPPRREAHRAVTRPDLYLSRIGGLGVYRWSSRSVQGSVRRLDGGIGAPLRSVLGLAGHGLGERESE